MNRNLAYLSLLLISVFFLSCKNDKHPLKIQYVGEAQGTYYAITYFARDTLVGQSEIDSLLDAFDRSASIWVRESIISKVNNNTPGVKLDDHFIEIFKQSKRIWKETNGAFDITVGSLVNAWGFGFKNKIPVTQGVVDSLLVLVNFAGIKLQNGGVIKDNPNIQIDYNAIAQGYSVDLVGGFLKSKGIDRYLIDIGGEVLARGNKPNGKHWIVGIEKPAEEASSARKLEAKIEIQDKAIATSGNYRKFYEENGIRYSHTIDPKTGYPAKHTLLSATIMSDSASIADAYATALMVMGLEDAKIFLQKKTDLEAFLIYSTVDGNYETWATKKLSGMIAE
jgi:thiamine biosynthesis lipoprotein